MLVGIEAQGGGINGAVPGGAGGERPSRPFLPPLQQTSQGANDAASLKGTSAVALRGGGGGAGGGGTGYHALAIPTKSVLSTSRPDVAPSPSPTFSAPEAAAPTSLSLPRSTTAAAKALRPKITTPSSPLGHPGLPSAVPTRVNTAAALPDSPPPADKAVMATSGEEGPSGNAAPAATPSQGGGDGGGGLADANAGRAGSPFRSKLPPLSGNKNRGSDLV